MEKHTPGPWSVGVPRGVGKRQEWPEVPVHVGEFSNRGNCIALVYMGGDAATLSTSEAVLANANLIAEAPNMYELLKRAQEELRMIRMKDSDAVYDVGLRVEMERVLAQAEGR